MTEACTFAGVLPAEQFNIVKLYGDGNGVSLLRRTLVWGLRRYMNP